MLFIEFSILRNIFGLKRLNWQVGLFSLLIDDGKKIIETVGKGQTKRENTVIHSLHHLFPTGGSRPKSGLNGPQVTPQYVEVVKNTLYFEIQQISGTELLF